MRGSDRCAMADLSPSAPAPPAGPRWPYLIGCGLAMGSADVVPGVSGGSMAFILGIYGQLLEAIAGFDLKLLALLRRGLAGEPGAWAAAVAQVHLGFLLPLLAGLASSILLLVRPITWLYAVHPEWLFAFFFGLIVGSIVLIARHAHWGASGLVAMALGAAGALVFVTRVPVTMPHDPFTLFWSGAVAIMAMILPGISGSFLLLVLGQYQHVMEAVKGLDLATLVPFALGCATGLLAFVRVLRWLLARWHGQTVALLVGVMAGSLWKIWPFRTVLESTTNAKGKLIVLRDALAAPADGGALVAALLLGAIGVLLVVGLERLQERRGMAEMGG
jgi:putative membrane protein